MWEELSSVVKNALLFMFDRPSKMNLFEFVNDGQFSVDTIDSRGGTQMMIVVSPAIYKKHENNFQAIKQELYAAFLRDHGATIDRFDIRTDWTKLQILSTNILPVITEWQEINTMQKDLVNQVHISNTNLDFQKIGLTCRILLQRLADVVFKPEIHTPKDNKRDLGIENYKNRLWAFVIHKLSGESNKEIREYTLTILQSSDKAVDLANKTTHDASADLFLSQSCAISTITTVHLIKLAYDRTIPAVNT